MTDPAHDLRFEIRELARALDNLSPRGTAAIFGVCGKALAPLLKQVEERSGGRWAIPDLDAALDLVEAFATGSDEAGDHRRLRERLMAVTAPDGHPWGTFVQDVLICADAGLAAASADDHPRSMWIDYALEPLIAVMENRDADVIRMYGDKYWSREILRDPTMATAIGFLRGLIAEISQTGSVGPRKFDELVREAAVLRPMVMRLQHRQLWAVSADRSSFKICSALLCFLPDLAAHGVAFPAGGAVDIRGWRCHGAFGIKVILILC
jgi:hypothetical protein